MGDGWRWSRGWVAVDRSSLWRSHGEVAAARPLTEGLWRDVAGPSTIRFANGPPPHGFATGRIRVLTLRITLAKK